MTRDVVDLFEEEYYLLRILKRRHLNRESRIHLSDISSKKLDILTLPRVAERLFMLGLIDGKYNKRAKTVYIKDMVNFRAVDYREYKGVDGRIYKVYSVEYGDVNQEDLFTYKFYIYLKNDPLSPSIIAQTEYEAAIKIFEFITKYVPSISGIKVGSDRLFVYASRICFILLVRRIYDIDGEMSRTSKKELQKIKEELDNLLRIFGKKSYQNW